MRATGWWGTSLVCCALGVAGCGGGGFGGGTASESVPAPIEGAVIPPGFEFDMVRPVTVTLHVRDQGVAVARVGVLVSLASGPVLASGQTDDAGDWSMTLSVPSVETELLLHADVLGIPSDAVALVSSRVVQALGS